jgi:hypothetical protein
VQTTVNPLRQFQNAIKSPKTKETYTLFLQNFQTYLKAPNCETLLQEYTIKEMEMKIIGYIMYLRDDRKVSPSTILSLVRIWEVSSFKLKYGKLLRPRIIVDGLHATGKKEGLLTLCF